MFTQFTYSFDENDLDREYYYPTKEAALDAARKAYAEEPTFCADVYISEINIRNNDDNEIVYVWEEDARGYDAPARSDIENHGTWNKAMTGVV